jgi:hypothetical protein
MYDPKNEVRCEIGGRHYTLAFTIGARRRVEAYYGRRLRDIARDFEGDPDDIDLLVTFFWGCLSRSHREIALEDVWALLEDLGHADRGGILAAVAEAIRKDSEMLDGGSGDARPQKPAATGIAKKRSGTL